MSRDAQNFYKTMLSVWDSMDMANDQTADSAHKFLRALAGVQEANNLENIFRDAVNVLHAEFDNAPKDRKEALLNLQQLIDGGDATEKTIVHAVWRAFFPEALHLDDNPEKQIELLRRSRRIDVHKLVDDPIDDVPDQIVFTSNVLLSPPVPNRDSDANEEVKTIVQGADEVNKESQQYWYDHPIPIGIPPQNDEVVYGLKGMAQTLAFEKKRGTARSSDRLTMLLSVSVTHSGLHCWAGPWLKAQLAGVAKERFEGLDVFAFTEVDTDKIVDVLVPWLDNPDDEAALRKTFGVDGEYGRHYSFLKAMPALWAILDNPNIKATFKIDLDQIFPQEVLTEETGKSAFEHFKTPLWGALGKDVSGQDVELGMIAGALVNEKDISDGLFTPDIPWPSDLPQGGEFLFFKQRPMAVSTRAELNTRNGDVEPIYRIHVTGGTNGIRLDALRCHQPFTPSFIGRAEDQGYLLSVLTNRRERASLRYVHASGLIMRHDKAAFAGDAVKAGKAGSYVGDLIRILVFSAYAGFLPDGPEKIKRLIDPFTGCFVTPLPITLVMLSLALHLLTPSNEDGRKSILSLANIRLPDWVKNYDRKSTSLKSIWHQEKRGWNAYYTALNNLEAAVQAESDEAHHTSRRFKEIVKNCRITDK